MIIILTHNRHSKKMSSPYNTMTQNTKYRMANNEEK